MLRYTQHFLNKIESVFQEGGYTIRYEKGNFQFGYCVVQHKKIAVINKFYDIEGRIGSLIDMLQVVVLDEEALSTTSMKLYQEMMKESALKEKLEEPSTQSELS
ncbi:MAG: hypothetical protein ABIV51_01960 [Saprospiraceae bacterium]